MATTLPQRTAGAHLPRQSPPPKDGWFGTHRWPSVDADDQIRQAVDVLGRSELPEDLQELGELLRRVANGLANLPQSGPADDAAGITPTTCPAARNHGSKHAR